MESFYNIHNFFKIKINQDNLNLANSYNHYLRHFKIDEKLREGDYEIWNFSDFKLPNNYISNSDKSISFNNGAYFPREKYAIVFKDGKIIEYTTYANRATNLYIQALLVNRGLSFIHSAGVEINGRGIIFPALGGVGKTILMSELRKDKSFKFFGDDFVIINKAAKMYSYPSDFSIYRYHLSVFKELKNTTFSRYLRMRKIFWPIYFFKRAVNFAAKRFTLKGVPIFTNWGADYVKVPVTALIHGDRIGSQVSLSAGILLSRFDGKAIKIEEITLDQFTREVLNILDTEFSGGFRYLQKLAVSGFFDMDNFENNQREIIRQCFSKIKLYRILIPHDIDYKSYCEQVIKFIKENIS